MRHTYLEPLFSRLERPLRSVLSVYLDIDESKEANLNRGFETRLKGIFASLHRTLSDQAEADRFTIAAARIADFVAAHEVHAHSLALFYDTTDGFFWHEEFNVPMESGARWERELFLQPLAAALDEFEKYGIVLLDHANMRLFRMFLGDIEEIAHRNFSRKAVQHIRSVGRDQVWSATYAQQKADEKVRGNLRRVVTDIATFVRAERVEHLLLAGAPEVTSGLLDLLPRRLAMLVKGTLYLQFDASPSEVFRTAFAFAEKAELGKELIIVRDVLTAAAKNEHAIAGVGRTLNAVNQGRVWHLIYSVGFSLPGFECSKCSALNTIARDACGYCGGELQRVSDVVERAVVHSLRHGARIEVVKEEAARALNLKGGIAAFLKARTASLRA